MYDISIRIKDASGSEHCFDVKTQSHKNPAVSVTNSVQPSKQNTPVKIGADGSHLPADATNHVAVLDPRTGLMWAVESLGGARGVNQKDASSLLNGFALLGHTNWRVPEIEELQTLVKFTASNPAIDADLFPGTKSDWYWTNTAYAPSPTDVAWFVSFSFGYSVSGGRDYSFGFVRGVRSVASSGQ